MPINAKPKVVITIWRPWWGRWRFTVRGFGPRLQSESRSWSYGYIEANASVLSSWLKTRGFDVEVRDA